MSRGKSYTSYLSMLVKLAVASALVAWLVQSGRLDLSTLSVLWEDPWLMVQCIVVWLLGSTALGAVRWMYILRALGVRIAYLRAFQLQLVGFFFNTVMPGSVGGDLIKAFYVIRQDKASVSAVSMSVVLDRIVGLLGIFVMGASVIVWDMPRFMNHPGMMSVAAYVFVGLGVLVAFFAACMVPNPWDAQISSWLARIAPLLRLYRILRSLQGQIPTMAGVLSLTLIIQWFYLLLFYSISQKLNSGIDLSSLAAVYPLGVLLTAVPIAPAGIGVGHAAFAELFRMVGASQGANVFNVYLITQLALNLLGVIPYVRLGVGFRELKASKEES